MGLMCGIQMKDEWRGSDAMTATGYGHRGNTIWGLPKIMGKTGEEAIKLMMFYTTSI